ncbi:MAG: sigma-70 family RNA polymerase sigma factor [Planctomycetota bacterium]
MSTDDTSEQDARLAADGDRAAFERLLDHHRHELHAFVRLRFGTLLKNQESSADLVQSVCREVLENADRFQHPEGHGFRRWLFTTALRKIKNRQTYYLAAKRDVLRRTDGTTGRSDEALIEHYRTFSTPSQAASTREEIARIEDAFEHLSEGQREVLTLAYLANLSRREIAEQIGKSEGAVRVTLHRALAKLSAYLEPDDQSNVT